MGEAVLKLLTGIELLAKIGSDLDANVDLAVDDGGIVLPGRFTHQTVELGGKGADNGRQASRRPAAGQRERSAGGSGSTGRPSSGEPWTARLTPSVFSQLGLTGEQASILEGVARAYPQMQVRTTPDLIWLILLYFFWD